MGSRVAHYFGVAHSVALEFSVEISEGSTAAQRLVDELGEKACAALYNMISLLNQSLFFWIRLDIKNGKLKEISFQSEVILYCLLQVIHF